MIATYVLLCWAVIATLTDVTQQKIYNWTTYSGMVLAMTLSCGQTLLKSDVYSRGWPWRFTGRVCGLRRDYVDLFFVISDRWG